MKQRLVLSFLLLLLGGCDWIHSSFINGIPFNGNSDHETHVYVGLDGVAHHTMLKVMERGGFSGPDWHLAKFVTMFPATSDVSWTRILHTEPIPSYEMEYYDPTADSIRNKGIASLIRHIFPTLTEGIDFENQYMKAFDYRANGYLHGFHAYGDTYTSLSDSLDNFFVTLEGQMQTRTSYSAYLVEFDVLGHMAPSEEDVIRALKDLSRRIEAFKSRNPRRRVKFTFLSDHGMDFVPVSGEKLIRMENELGRVNIDSVESLRDIRSGHISAIPIRHTRVSYISLHTTPEMSDEVALRTSSLPSVEMTIARLQASPGSVVAPPNTQWFGIWKDGRLAITFGFDPAHDHYLVGETVGGMLRDLQVQIGNRAANGEFVSLSDDEAFAITKNGNYPDLFYRARTGLAQQGILYPGDVLVSFKVGYASVGFSLLGNDMVSISGFHGAMNALSSNGILLSNERTLPDTVRSDTFFQLFPNMKEHMKKRGLRFYDGDPNESLMY